MADNKERLVGSDGKLVTVTFGSEVSSITDDGWYRVEAIATTTTGLPANAEVGTLVYLTSADTLSWMVLYFLCSKSPNNLPA